MKNIRWGWILLGGFFAELMIFAIVLPIAMLAGEESLLYTAAPASLIGTFVCGWWVAKKAAYRRVLHGVLVGAAGILIYIVMSLGAPEPLAFVIAHVLKLAGGAGGGFAFGWRSEMDRSSHR